MQEGHQHRVERLKRRHFERLVSRSFSRLPKDILDLLDNIVITVEDEPDWGRIDEQGEQHDELFGLYEGIPLTERSSSDSMVMPDRITIFRGPLERSFPDSAELAFQVRVTLVHEISHHLGIDENRIEQLGWS